MKTKVVMILAWRNLWRNYRRTFVMLAAVTVGVWAMIFMSALMRGMVDQMALNALETFVGHIQIHQQDYRSDPSIVNSMPSPDAQFQETLDESVAWTERVRVPAVINSERESRGVTLMGIDPQREAAMSFIADGIVEGRYLENSEDKGVIIGAKLAQKLDTRLGKRIVIMSQDPQNNIVDKGARIVGIYKASLSATEERFVFMDINIAQKFLGMSNQISEIEVRGENFRKLDSLNAQIQQQISARPEQELESATWVELDSYLDTMLGVMDGFVLVWMIVVFIALSFGLINTLIMAVFERTREIGLMLALGMRPKYILNQVVLESIFLLALGLFAGTSLAWLSIKPLESGIDLSVVAEGMAMMGAGSTLYPSLTVKDMLTANVVVITLGLLASLFPAWRASRLQPVNAMNVS